MKFVELTEKNRGDQKKRYGKAAALLLLSGALLLNAACRPSNPEDPTMKSGEETVTEATETTTAEETQEAKVYEAGDLLLLASWIGKPLSDLGIGEEYIDRASKKLSVSGTLFDMQETASVYLDSSNDSVDTVSNILIFPGKSEGDLPMKLALRCGSALAYGEEPYAEAKGGVVSWAVFDGGDQAEIRVSTGEENDFYLLELQKKSAADEAAGLPPYRYSGDDPLLPVITDYFSNLYAQESEVPGRSVTIPAFCIHRRGYTSDGQVLVHGTFWEFSYVFSGKMLCSAGGRAFPGILTFSQDENGNYAVASFDRPAEGADLTAEITRITGGDEQLMQAYTAAQDVNSEALLSARKCFVSDYLKANLPDVSAYQEPGTDPVDVADGDISAVAALPDEPFVDLSDVMISLDPNWEFAGFSVIHSGQAKLQRAKANRKNIVVGVNAGHGTAGGASVYTQCHPDGTPKVTGGTTAAGATQAMAVSTGMTFFDGTPERDVNLREAQILRDLLLDAGYDVLMIRDSDDVQLDNVARTVICNNIADCHIAIHWDGDGLSYDKGCFCMTVPDGLKYMYPVSEIWQEDDRLGVSLVQGLQSVGAPIHGNGTAQLDLTQTSFSKIPSIDVELGNAASDHSDEALWLRARGLLAGINIFFGQ